jgi:uncharacterized protein (DUF1697 family)
MVTVVALLRGVNVGGRKLPMAELRELVESLGYDDVRTYIQSGNLLFRAAKRPRAAELEAAIEERFGLGVDVILRTPANLAAVARRDPFPRAERAKLHVGFMAAKPAASLVAALDGEPFLPDEFAVVGTELYLHLPGGMARTKLPDYVLRRLKVPTTVRNWNTVTKLVELSREL